MEGSCCDLWIKGTGWTAKDNEDCPEQWRTTEFGPGDLGHLERLYLERSSLTYVRPGQSFVSRSPWSS